MENLELNLDERAALIEKYWNDIAVEKDKKKRKQLVAEYNVMAEAYNTDTKHSSFAIITANTSVKISEEQVAVPISIVAAKAEPAAKGLGVVAQIIELHKKGMSNKEIIESGFNKSTVNRQVNEYKKRKNERK